MLPLEIFSNEFFKIEEENEKVFITVFRIGFLLLDFNKLLELNPRIEITNFMELRMALMEATGEKVQIGILRPLISLTISKDKMEVKVKINDTDENFFSNPSEYIGRIAAALKQNKITDGILMDVINYELIPRREIVIAQGIPPVDGEPAIVTYYQLSERKPTIREDGNADYYDMNFIDEVEKGDWLGEKVDPTEGTPGRTVTGEILMQKKGKDKRILYDKKTVEAVREGNKLILRAKINGVVKFVDNKITVGNHLIIDGDVGVETGNIEFDGSVEVRGTVQNGFSVCATGDISILSDLGIYGAKLIESQNGDIFIKGGLFGLGKSLVRAGGSIFIKHANECFLEAGEDINIGYYSIGSSLTARNVLTDEKKGKLIGGVIEAKGKVKAAYIGNKMERKTIINVEGFDRDQIKKELDELLLHYKDIVIEVEQLKRQLEIFENFIDHLDENQKADYKEHLEKYEGLMAEVAQIETCRKALMDFLNTKGEGQVLISQEAFPEVLLEIKNIKKKLNHSTRGTFYALGKDLHFE